MTEYFHLLPYATVIIGCILLFVFCLALFLEDNSIIDIAYGPTFVMVSWIIAWFWTEWSWRQMILLLFITLWGLRLGLRILWKNWGKPEDFRYRAWREAWVKKGMLYFFLRSLTQIYLLQGIVIVVVLTPVFMVFSQAQMPLTWLNWGGLGLWLVGFFFETVGDFQLDRFSREPANQGKLMTTGLWKYTRHPNYFGEATMWWGIWILILGLPLTSFAIVSPLIVTFLLLHISGVPMLEARWRRHPDWEEYQQKTNVFFPWIPKKI